MSNVETWPLQQVIIEELIIKWFEAVSYSNTENQEAYLVKAIREKW